MRTACFFYIACACAYRYMLNIKRGSEESSDLLYDKSKFWITVILADDTNFETLGNKHVPHLAQRYGVRKADGQSTLLLVTTGAPVCFGATLTAAL